MKYIVVHEMEIEVPIIFSELQTHSYIAAGKKVISAGFCSFSVETVVGEDPYGSEDKTILDVNCWGESISLGVKSRLKEDAELILKHNELRI